VRETDSDNAIPKDEETMARLKQLLDEEDLEIVDMVAMAKMFAGVINSFEKLSEQDKGDLMKYIEITNQLGVEVGVNADDDHVPMETRRELLTKLVEVAHSPLGDSA